MGVRPETTSVGDDDRRPGGGRTDGGNGKHPV